MRIEFCATPYSFVETPGVTTIWKAPQCRDKGVYLWCFEHQGEYLINYVGMTVGQSGFEGRLWTELKDWRAGRYTVGVDLEQFKAGYRIPRPECTVEELQAQRIALEPMCRLFLAPIGDAQITRQVENFIVHSLMKYPFTAQYLGNLKPERYKWPGVDFQIACAAPLIGLTAGLLDRP